MRCLTIPAILFCLTLLTACASTPSPDNTTSQIDLQSLDGKTLVYGRIRWLENGAEKNTGEDARNQSISPKYLRIEDMEQGALTVEADGHFFWVLPEGTYMLHQIHWFDPWDGPHRINPSIAFYVPGEQEALCIGTLNVDILGKRDVIGGLWIKGRSITIDDECEDIYQQHINPELNQMTLLMAHNQGLPDRPEALENRDKLIDFIRAIIPGLMTIY
jgi:hypothetical protein